jgi:hypothetical protein
MQRTQACSAEAEALPRRHHVPGDVTLEFMERLHQSMIASRLSIWALGCPVREFQLATSDSGHSADVCATAHR